jgi:hypothetical protein
VVHLIPPRAPAAGHSSGANRCGKAPTQIVESLDVAEEENDDETDMDAYLNTAMFSTQQVQIF